MTAFGLSPLGTGLGPFGGPGLITVLGALPLSNNAFVVVFDREPYTLDPQAVTSATNPDNYGLAAVDPTYTADDGSTHVPAGEVVPTRYPRSAIAEVDRTDRKQVIIRTEATLEPRVRYSVNVAAVIRGVGGETFAGPQLHQFRAPRLSGALSRVLVSQQRYRDLDYIIAPERGEVGAVYRHDPSGDIGIQDADTSLKKRIMRRIFSDKGSFAWDPTYGVGIKVKALAKSGRVQELSSMIAEQIRREPDVGAVGVEVYVTRDARGRAFVEIDARVQRVDARSVRVAFRREL